MSKNRYKILYIDDEIVNLRLFKHSFRKDFEIFTAESGIKGLEILEKREIDVVITDQQMPEMTGVELLEIINKKYPELPPCRLIVSGFSRDEDIEKAFDKFQLFSFVSKPWNYEKLKQTIINSVKNGKK